MGRCGSALAYLGSEPVAQKTAVLCEEKVRVLQLPQEDTLGPAGTRTSISRIWLELVQFLTLRIRESIPPCFMLLIRELSI